MRDDTMCQSDAFTPKLILQGKKKEPALSHSFEMLVFESFEDGSTYDRPATGPFRTASSPHVHTRSPFSARPQSSV